MNVPSRPTVSTFMLLILSPLLTIGSLIAYSLSSVRNTFDFLVPIVGIAQLVFVIGLFLGRLWGLIGYSITVISLCVATILYYVPKGDTDSALKTLAFMLPFVLLVTYYWTVKRSWFK
jgi:hypothetical protein